MKKPIHTDKAPAAIGPYSQAVAYGDLVFLSGQIALDPDTGELKNQTLEEEVHQVMTNIGAILDSLGMSYEQVIKTSIFIRDMDDFARINEVYGSYFKGDYPARETVEVSRLPKDVMVEISAIAGR